jgi:hypothetical protein
MIVPSDSETKLKDFFASRGLNIETSKLGDIVTAFLDFYEFQPVAGLATTPQADMLLFQFGVYDLGQGEIFDFDVTRQFIVDDKEDDDAISQLHVSVNYEPTDELRAIGESNVWCKSQDELSSFKTFIFSSKAYLTAQNLQRKQVTIFWDQV